MQSRFGLTPVEVYGTTEASSITTVNRDGPRGSVGQPLPFYDVTSLAEDGSAVAQAGAIGEIAIRDRGSGRLTTGYWRQPTATRALLPGDGKLHTGDLGWMDPHGYLYFSGRRKTVSAPMARTFRRGKSRTPSPPIPASSNAP